jgi:predicted TIM-barrel fold metal-dependent hydrolase
MGIGSCSAQTKLFGPQTVGVAINAIQEAPFLTEEQKRDILHNHAARFLKLTH